MKKVLLLLALAVSFIACEGPMGPMGPSGFDGMNGRDGHDGRDGKDGQDGRDGKDGSGTNWLTKTFTIQPHEWSLNGKPDEVGAFFYVDKSLPELTRDIFYDKAVIAYIKTEEGVKNGIPYVLHKGTVDEEGKETLWTQTFDCDYEVGWVRFYLTFSDFFTGTQPSEAFTFHVLLMW